MSVGSGGLGTVYSRLPQSTSDVESSEDEVSQHENLIFYRKIGTPKKGNVKEEDIGKLAMKDYQPLSHEGGPVESHEVQVNGFSNINYNYPHGAGGTGIEEETMVMGPLGTSGSSANKKEGGGRHGNLQMLVGNQHPMSMMRQVAFVMSLCLCIFVIVAFLWVLPCNWSTCPIMQYDRQTGSSWERTLRHLELIGRISVVPSGNDEHHNLLFMFRGEITVPDRDKEQETTEFSKPIQVTPKKEIPTPVPANKGGLIVLMGSTGTVVWYKTLHSVPRDIDCNLTDFNGDKRTDCLLIGTNDLMCAFDPVSANILWFVNVDKWMKYIPSDMEFPLMLPDLDGDNVLDFAFTCRVVSRSSSNFTDKPAHNKIALASGQTGKLFGEYYHDAACHTVYRLNLDNKFFLTYRCVDAGGIETVKEIDIVTLYNTIAGYKSSMTLQNLKSWTPTMPKQHYSANNGPPDPVKLSGEPRLEPGKPASYSVLQRKLVVTNQGSCPEDCTASAVVYEKPNKTVWSDGGKKMYALRPGILMFTSHTSKYSSENKDTQVGSVSGFAVKFWHWTTCEKSSIWSSQQRHQKRMVKDTEWAASSQSSDLWHEGSAESKPAEYIESRESRIGVTGINTTTKSLSRNSSTVTITYHPKDEYNTVCLKERIVLVTFNDTDMHLVNASESEIKQICANLGCQPSLAYQEQSLIIADLDGDGSKELVSYLTTYETEDDGVPGSDRLTLLSKVRVVRLEAELPKLYEAVTHL